MAEAVAVPLAGARRRSRISPRRLVHAYAEMLTPSTFARTVEFYAHRAPGLR